MVLFLTRSCLIAASSNSHLSVVSWRYDRIHLHLSYTCHSFRFSSRTPLWLIDWLSICWRSHYSALKRIRWASVLIIFDACHLAIGFRVFQKAPDRKNCPRIPESTHTWYFKYTLLYTLRLRLYLFGKLSSVLNLCIPLLPRSSLHPTYRSSYEPTPEF